MTPPEAQAGGLLEKLRRVGDSLLALARSRVELFAVELQEEKLRLLGLLVWFGVALALGLAALLVVMGALAIWLWELAGYLGLVVLALTAFACAVGIVWGMRRRIRIGPMAFADTIAGFRKDGECLRRNK